MEIQKIAQPLRLNKVAFSGNKVKICPICNGAKCINCQPLHEILRKGIKKQGHSGLLDLFA